MFARPAAGTRRGRRARTGTELSAATEVRPLTAADAREYFAFRLAGLEESPLAFGRSAEKYRLESTESVAAALHERRGEAVTLGAFVGGRLSGAMTLVRNPALKQWHKASVYAVYVAPFARGQRLGDRLLAALIDWARAAGIGQMHRTVSVTQNADRMLYLRHGFAVYGLEPRAMRIDGQDVDEELMVRFLDDGQSAGNPDIRAGRVVVPLTPAAGSLRPACPGPVR